MNKEQFDNLRELMDDYADMLKVRDNMKASLTSSDVSFSYDPWLTKMFFDSAADYESILCAMRHAALEVAEKEVGFMRERLAEMGVTLEDGEGE